MSFQTRLSALLVLNASVTRFHGHCHGHKTWLEHPGSWQCDEFTVVSPNRCLSEPPRDAKRSVSVTGRSAIVASFSVP